jgi:hypothetical protein
MPRFGVSCGLTETGRSRTSLLHQNHIVKSGYSYSVTVQDHDHVDWNTNVVFARSVHARTLHLLERQNVQIGIASDTQPHNAPLSCMRLREPCFVILFPYDSSLANSARTSPLTFSVSLSDCPSSFAWALSSAAACSSAASDISTSPAGAIAAAGCASGDSGGVGTAVGDCVLDSVAGTGSAPESSSQYINIETVKHGLTHRSWLESWPPLPLPFRYQHLHHQL